MSEWVPQTNVGRLVFEGKIASIDEIFSRNLKITEPEIVDVLIPNISQEVLDVKLVQRQTDAGERSRYKAIVAVGNEEGYVGLGSGKSEHVVTAIDKAVKEAKKNIIPVRRGCGSWECACGEPHSILTLVEGKVGSVKVVLLPGPKGLGIVAGDIPRTILKLAGVRDIWTRTFGETRTSLSIASATYEALRKTNSVVLPTDWK